MKTLLVLRHAKAEDAVAGSPDFDRALSERGRIQAHSVGEFIKTRNEKFDLVLSSTASRARKTAETVISAAGLHCDIRFEQEIYEASWQVLRTLLLEIDEAVSSLMLVGHNPGLEDLILELTGRSEHLSPATIAKIGFEAEQWSRVRGNSGTLDWLVSPRASAALTVPI